jgi:aminopeptidase N
VLQSAIAEQPTLRPHRLGIGLYDLIDGSLVRVHAIEVDIDRAATEIPELVGVAKPGLILLNDEDLAYAKIRLDAESHKLAMDKLSAMPDSLARSLVWTAAWDATRDAEAPAADFIELVLSHIALETESTTVTILLRQLLTTGQLYTAPASRAARLEQIAEGLIALAEQAAPGSDKQLQFAKFAAQVAQSGSQLDWLQAVLDGSKVPAGLVVDADLRWELTTGLVVGGRLSEAEITAELARDNTANGQKFAAAARAALATAEAKAAAWHTLVETEEYSNTLVNAASLAFGRVNDTKLLEPYLQKYHEVALKIWNSRSYHMASYLLTNLYPVALANEQLAAATRAAIALPEFVERPALRRILVENLANVDRALKAQAADRG